MHNMSLYGLLNKVGVNVAPTVSGVINSQHMEPETYASQMPLCGVHKN